MYSVDFNTFRVKMIYTFREPNFFTFRVNYPQIVSIFTSSVDILSHVAAFLYIEAFSRFEGATHFIIGSWLTNHRVIT